jgi:hypothetical protein
MELGAHGVVVVASHCTYFATLGGLAALKLGDLLRDPTHVSWGSENVCRMTYCFANSICESFLPVLTCALPTPRDGLRSSELLTIHGSSWWKKTVRT